MALTFVGVTTYRAIVYGGPNGKAGADALVTLGIPDAWVFLRFYPEGTTLPDNRKATHASGKFMYYVSYRSAQLSNVIDLLRNEKPIYFYFRDDTMAAYITTASEPVGEEEEA